jgi:hypothetical protein
MKTKIFLDNFKGHKMFAVWEVNDQGEKQGEFPIVSFGGKKATAVANHIEELKDYVNTVAVENERKGK